MVFIVHWCLVVVVTVRSKKRVGLVIENEVVSVETWQRLLKRYYVVEKISEMVYSPN